MLLSLDLSLKCSRCSLGIQYVDVHEAIDICGVKINCLPSKIGVIFT